MAEFAVVSTLAYCYDLRPIYDTNIFYVQDGWNVTKPPTSTRSAGIRSVTDAFK